MNRFIASFNSRSVDLTLKLIKSLRERPRREARRLLGWKEVPVTVVSLKDLAKGEIEENRERKDFTITEIVEIKRYLEPRIAEEARERMLSGKPSGKFPEGNTRDIIANYVGVSGRTLEMAEAIVEATESV